MNHFRIKIFLAVVFASAVSLTISAIGQIKGVVLDASTKLPLAGVNVVVEGTGLGASTDNNGNYFIFAVIPGKYRVTASMMGYSDKTTEITVKAEETIVLNFVLQPKMLQLATVTVTGRSERNLMQEPALESPGLEIATSTVRRREIKRQAAKTVIDALQYVPGALIETRGRKVKQFFSIRGQRYPYPEYAVNGAWQREFGETPYFFSAADIDHIEVIRSSAALLQGINGMAGIINIVTREYESPETLQEIEYGTFGAYRLHLSHGAKIGNLSYATGLGTQHTDGPAGLHAVEEMTNFFGSVRWTPSDQLTIRGNIFHLNGKRELRLAEPPAAKRFLTELWRFDPFRSTLINLKADYRFSEKVATEITAYYTDRDPIFIDEDENSHQIRRVSERDYEWGVNLIQSLALSPQNTLRFGGMINHWIAPNGKRFYQGRRNDLQTVSAVIVDEHRIGALTVDGGFRWAKTFINEFGGFGINGSGKGFAKVEPIKDQWQPAVPQASFGMAYTFPNLGTVNLHFSAGEVKPLPGSLDVNLSEPLNETRVKVDIGLRKFWREAGQISAVGFATLQKNALVLSGKTYSAPSRIMELYLNRDQDQYGVELEVRSVKILQVMETFFNMTAMNSRARQAGEMRRNGELPQWISSGGIYLLHGSFDGAVLGKYVSGYASARFAANGVPQPLGNFFVVNANFGWTVGKTYTTRFYLEYKNLTDVHYATVVGYPDFGRQVTIGIRQIFK